MRRLRAKLVEAEHRVEAAFGFGVRAGLVAAAFVALASRGSWARRGIVFVVLLALAAAAQTAPFVADVLFFQMHNLVAVALWFMWRKRVGHAHLLVLSAILLSVLVIALAPVPAIVIGHWTGLSIETLAATLSLSSDPDRAHRFVLLFAFAQAVHYLVWLRLVPDEDRASNTPRSFRQSLRALKADLGAAGVAITLILAAAIVALAAFKLTLGRDVYLGIAYAHGHVELVAASLFVAEGRRPRAS